MWILLLTSTGPICLPCIAHHVPHPVWIGPQGTPEQQIFSPRADPDNLTTILTTQNDTTVLFTHPDLCGLVLQAWLHQGLSGPCYDDCTSATHPIPLEKKRKRGVYQMVSKLCQAHLVSQTEVPPHWDASNIKGIAPKFVCSRPVWIGPQIISCAVTNSTTIPGGHPE